MEIEEFIFGDNLRKRIVCFFYRCSWYSVTKTGPRQQRIHEVISYIKTQKNSILQVHTFCNTVVYYKHTQIYTYEHLITNMEWQTVVLYYIYYSNSGNEDRCWLSGWFVGYKQEDVWKAGVWSRKSRPPTPGNFDYPTPTPTFSCISYLLNVIILFRWIHKPYLHSPGIRKLVLNRCKCTIISHSCKIRSSRS